MDEPRFQLSRSDAVDWLRTLPSESIDLVVTDPPYESLEKHRAIGTTTRLKHSKASSNDWFEIFPNARFGELFVEVYRVLKKNTHFYLYCDPETMFVAKPLAEQVGFKFWKPLIWDKCLAPETLVWTERGVLPIGELVEGDRVGRPEGGSTTVRATRRTRAASLKLVLSDGTEVIASREHRFMRGDGTLCEARELRIGDSLCTRRVRQRIAQRTRVRIPGSDDIALNLDYELGRMVGLHAVRLAEELPFAGPADAELAASPAAMRRWIANRELLRKSADIAHLFVGGAGAGVFLRRAAYETTEEFRHGLLDALLGGDVEQFTTPSADLAMFVRRELPAHGCAAAVTYPRRETEHEAARAGRWTIRFTTATRARPTTVVAIEDAGERELVDISVTDRDELFLLASGVVTHNCKIGMGYHYRARYECILFFEKGKRKLNDLGTADIIEHPRVNGGYPAEKPPQVSTVLIGQSTQPGELVIDPFMGSGSSGVAAVTQGRHFAGNDLCEEAVQISRRRLLEAGAKEPLHAFGTDAVQSQLGLQM